MNYLHSGSYMYNPIRRMVTTMSTRCTKGKRSRKRMFFKYGKDNHQQDQKLLRFITNRNVQFQKISIPTPWKVNENSEGVGGLKSQNFKRKVWGLSGNSRGVGGGGFKPKNLPWEGYGYFMEQHNGCQLQCF